MSFPLRFLRLNPAEFRNLLDRLGPIFIKIGQFLALRPDLIPQSYCNELMTLLDLVPPFPWSEARAILTKELGREPQEVFTYLNQTPLAAGSLAQVHLGRLLDGSTVAVKVLRPDIERIIERDIKRARRIARLLERTGTGFIASPMEVVDELADWLKQEIDLSIELFNMSRMYRLAANSRIQHIPHAFPELSTQKVLVAEYVRGIPLSEVLRSLRSDRPERFQDQMDRTLFAERLVLATLTQLFHHQFFHADLHPGNVLVLPGNVVGFVDFGLCDELDSRVHERQLRYLTALYSGETEQIFRALTDILIPGEDTDIERFRRDFSAETRRLESDDTTRTAEHNGRDGGDAQRSPIASYLVGLMRAARRNHLRVPPQILSMYRSLLMVETVANQLGTRDPLRTIGRRFFANLQREELIAQLSDVDTLQSMLVTLVNLKRQAPGQVNQILTELASGSLNLRVETSEASWVAVIRNRRVGLITTAIVAVSVSLLLTRPSLPVVFGISLHWPLAMALVLLYLGLWLQWKRLQRL